MLWINFLFKYTEKQNEILTGFDMSPRSWNCAISLNYLFPYLIWKTMFYFVAQKALCRIAINYVLNMHIQQISTSVSNQWLFSIQFLIQPKHLYTLSLVVWTQNTYNDIFLYDTILAKHILYTNCY